VDRHQPERHGGDGADARSESVQAIDPVNGVGDPDDPEHRHRGRPQPEGEHGSRVQRVGNDIDTDTERNHEEDTQHLRHQLPARTEVVTIIQQADDGKERARKQDAEPCLESGAQDPAPEAPMEHGEGRGDGERERRIDGEATPAGDRMRVKVPRARLPRRPAAERQPLYEGRETEADERRDEPGDHG
jgi:hypothetical protein